MKKAIFTSLIILTVMFITGCAKYEEGPKISFLSKTKRLCKEWEFTEVISTTGGDITNLYANETWKFEEDGTLTKLFSGATGVIGTWEFSGDTDIITNTSNQEKIIEIVRLKNKELWLDDNNNEYKMKPGF